ncbi:unnamed protein product [Lampetra planeri]
MRTDRLQRHGGSCSTTGPGSLLLLLLVVVALSITQLGPTSAFNLDDSRPNVFSGPQGSYFGYSLDFYSPESSSKGIVVGAPKAHTDAHPNVTQPGAVFMCLLREENCTRIPLGPPDERYTQIRLGSPPERMEFKSHQWFGATVRTHGETLLACAPLYSWRTFKSEEAEQEPVGTCFLSRGNFSSQAEYSPCRTGRSDQNGQGVCQAGFSADFTKAGWVVLGGPGSFFAQGQVMAASSKVVFRQKSRFLLSRVEGQKETAETPANNDDTYMGYSVAVGEFTGDSVQEFVTGVPKGSSTFGYVLILNTTDMSTLMNVTGEQLASYFGYTVAVTDVNNDGLDDLLVGAPLYMERGSQGRLEELGRVYLYLQQAPLSLGAAQTLSGRDVYGRYGSAITPVGDLDQDGYNDVAVGMPFGGEDGTGVVFVYNGRDTGLMAIPSQTLRGRWASQGLPASFGFALRGGTDLDSNGYPDLIVGAFGVDKAIVYRARPVVTVSAELTVSPMVLHPENRSCMVTGYTTLQSCFSVEFCLKVSGKRIPDTVGMEVEVLLDKLKEKGAIRRVLFRDSKSPRFRTRLQMGRGLQEQCSTLTAYLRDESEFRDKLSPIVVSLNYSLDEEYNSNHSAVVPILNHYQADHIQKQAYILLDCGEDNICMPDLQLAGYLERTELYMGDTSPLTLTLNCSNHGEGAYEAELQVAVPPEGDYIGSTRSSEGLGTSDGNLFAPICTLKEENNTRLVVCDLGNPMKAGTNLLIGLRFDFKNMAYDSSSITFNANMKSTNKDNPESQPLALRAELAVLAQVDIRGVSIPDATAIYAAEWKLAAPMSYQEEIGPSLQQVFEVHNNGPSWVKAGWLDVKVPHQHDDDFLLYPLQIATEGPLNCTFSMPLNPLNLQERLRQSSLMLAMSGNKARVARFVVQRTNHDAIALLCIARMHTQGCSSSQCLHVTCQLGLLPRRTSAVLILRSRLWVPSFLKGGQNQVVLQTSAAFRVTEMPYKLLPDEFPSGSRVVNTTVVLVKAGFQRPVPYWVIFLAVLAGLLLLALLVYALWKMGFFKRERYMHDEIPAEKAFLKPRQNGVEA